MKKLLILGVFFLVQLCSTNNVNADFYILYDSTSKEIINIADTEDSFIIADTDKNKLSIKKFSGNFKDYEIDNLSDYKISGNNIVINTQKVSDKVAKKEQQNAKKEKLNSDKQKAKLKLIDLGLTEDEAEALIK